MNWNLTAFLKIGAFLWVLVGMALLLQGCAATQVTSVWVDPEYRGDTIDNVFVVGVAKDGGLRRMFEDEFVALFRERGISVTASYRILPDRDIHDEKKLDSSVKQSGSDFVMMTRLIDIRRDTQYVPPGYVYAPPPRYYRGWHRYYREAYMVSPGYTLEYKTAVLETTIYDVKNDTLIWTARSDAPVDGGVGSRTRDFAGTIMKRLAESGLIY